MLVPMQLPSSVAPGFSQPRTGWHSAVQLVKNLERPSTDLVSLASQLAGSQQPDGGWKQNPQAVETDLDSSVVNHLALATYLRRAAHAQAFPKTYESSQLHALTPDAQTLRSLRSTLEKSWLHLTGTTPAESDGVLQPLPRRKVLRHLSQAPAQLHEALLGSSIKVRLEPQQILREALTAADSALQGHALESQPKKRTDLVKFLAGGALVAGAAGLMALSPGLAQLALGAAVGWAVSSANESIVHEKILHLSEVQPGSVSSHKPATAFARLYAKSPEWLKKSVESIWFGHTKIHHFQTFKHDQVTQFKSPEEKAKLDAYLHKQGREDMIDEEYGATIGLKGHLMYQGISLPSYVAALGAAFALGAGPLFAVGFALPALGFQGVVKEYHRYTHMPAQKALETASYPMKLFLQTPLSRYNMRRHFVHHAEPTTNFNLMPGGDWLRGKSKSASVAQEEELRRLGVLW